MAKCNPQQGLIAANKSRPNSTSTTKRKLFSLTSRHQLGNWLRASVLTSHLKDGAVNSENKLHEFVCNWLNHHHDSCTRGCCRGSNLGQFDPKTGVLTTRPSCSPSNTNGMNTNGLTPIHGSVRVLWMLLVFFFCFFFNSIPSPGSEWISKAPSVSRSMTTKVKMKKAIPMFRPSRSHQHSLDSFIKIKIQHWVDLINSWKPSISKVKFQCRIFTYTNETVDTGNIF